MSELNENKGGKKDMISMIRMNEHNTPVIKVNKLYNNIKNEGELSEEGWSDYSDEEENQNSKPTDKITKSIIKTEA